MACISAPTAAIVGGGLSAAGSVGSGLLGLGAADTQSKAAGKAASIAQKQAVQTRKDLYPFINTGQSYATKLYDLLAYPEGELRSKIDLTPGIETKFSPSMASLEATPGYRFTLQQGLKAVQNKMASSGLGAGGPAGVGAAKYAAGLADTTYQDQFTNWLNTQDLNLRSWLDTQNLDLSQKKLLYNMLAGGATLGENAAAGAGALGTTLADTQGSYLTAAGASKAAGSVAAANALTGGLGSISDSLLAASLYGGLGGSGGGGGNYYDSSGNPLAGTTSANWS